MLLGLLAGTVQTYRVQHRPAQQQFTSGTVPALLPNGFHQGNPFSGIGKHWQGKVFDANNGTGINKFDDGERFVFKIYPATGLRDKQQVLKIDYNQPGNPLWLRFIVDEIVQTSPGHYLGKVHVRVIPGIVFTLTYFELTQK